jgi:hypothetical protein
MVNQFFATNTKGLDPVLSEPFREECPFSRQNP